MFPQSCVHCGKDGSLLCDLCIRDSTAVSKDVCRKCAEPLAKPGTCTRCVIDGSSLDRLYGSFLYETPVGTAVRAFKFDDVRALAGVLGGMFNVESMNRSEADLILPVPMHKSRLRSRGYNQSEILGRKLSRRMGLEFHSDVLIRAENTVPQSEQPTAAARKTAIQGAFSVDTRHESVVLGKRVLLVDDVFTTGSTVQAAASVLKAAGASWVGAAVLTVQPIESLK
mgnify:FL=1